MARAASDLHHLWPRMRLMRDEELVPQLLTILGMSQMLIAAARRLNPSAQYRRGDFLSNWPYGHLRLLSLTPGGCFCTVAIHKFTGAVENSTGCVPCIRIPSVLKVLPADFCLTLILVWVDPTLTSTVF